MNRRTAIGSMAGMTGAALWGSPMVTEALRPPGASRLRQSIAHWVLQYAAKPPTLVETCEIARELGCASVELVKTREELNTVRRHELMCAMVGLDAGEEPAPLRGLIHSAHWSVVFERIRRSIDLAAEFGCPNVIVFTGSNLKDPLNPGSPRVPRAEALRNCVEALRCLQDDAAKRNVVLSLEPLSGRNLAHPVTGFARQEGLDLDFCAEVVQQLNTPHVKLLFDVYHVQVMHGDVLRRMEQNLPHIGHIHIAGCPGRGGLIGRQEIAYPAVFETLIESGYRGFVGHEFIPDGDIRRSLQDAVRLCHGASNSETIVS